LLWCVRVMLISVLEGANADEVSASVMVVKVEVVGVGGVAIGGSRG
jgi:hypothetical protein